MVRGYKVCVSCIIIGSVIVPHLDPVGLAVHCDECLVDRIVQRLVGDDLEGGARRQSAGVVRKCGVRGSFGD